MSESRKDPSQLSITVLAVPDLLTDRRLLVADTQSTKKYISNRTRGNQLYIFVIFINYSDDTVAILLIK